MKMESTAAKIGLSMKKRENMALLLRFCFGFRLRLLGLRLRSRFSDAHRSARSEAHQALDDHLVARLHAFLDDPRIARPVADLDRPRLRGAFLVDHVDELALRPLEHRALRHGQRVGARRASK